MVKAQHITQCLDRFSAHCHSLLVTAILICALSTSLLSHAESIEAIGESIEAIGAKSKELTKLGFENCQIKVGPRSVDALCATLQRPENPDKPEGKQLDLAVAKFTSRSASPETDAFTIIQGGPGGSSIDLYVALQPIFTKILANRDIIVVDQRGTGRSNSLACPELPEDQIINPDQIQKLAIECRSDIEQKTGSDLRFYTTSLAVQDLEALRKSTGYEQLTIYGVSYGTRVAQHYLRRFPESTRALILDGVAHVGLNLAGGEISRQSQFAFDNMVERCNEMEQCVQQFGNLNEKFKELRQRLKDNPIEVSLPDPFTGKSSTQLLNDHSLLGAVRLMPYSTDQLSLLPNLIASAHAGDYLALAAFSKIMAARMQDSFAVGMNNSVMCAEDAPFVQQSDLSGVADTYFGNLMVEAMSATCAVWPRGSVDIDFHEEFESDSPVLIMSGETDPITPAGNGEIAHAMFNNSMHLVVPAHGHGVITKGCVPQLASDFVEHLDLKQLNPDCIKRERVMPFFFDTTGPQP